MYGGVARSDLLMLLTQGVEEASNGNKGLARQYLGQALDLDRENETALLWLAWLSDNGIEKIGMLERLVQNNPRNTIAKIYLRQARANYGEKIGSKVVPNSVPLADTVEHSQASRKKQEGATPLLGEYLISKGYINQNQLGMALARQKELQRNGKPRLIGQILVDFGFVDQEQVEESLQMRLLDKYLKS